MVQLDVALTKGLHAGVEAAQRCMQHAATMATPRTIVAKAGKRAN